MPTAILWPDVEALATTYLRASLAARPEAYADAVTVHRNLPSPRPMRAVTVRDDGGPVLGDVRAVARLGINVWAATDEDATDLANLVVALLLAWPDGMPVLTADPTRPYNVPDESGTL